MEELIERYQLKRDQIGLWLQSASEQEQDYGVSSLNSEEIKTLEFQADLYLAMIQFAQAMINLQK